MSALNLEGITESQLTDFARHLAPSLREGGVVFLRGELGAGKTTFARALLGALGVEARVKSPTYTLIEPYAVGDLSIYHLDLYRIADPGELEWLGLPDLMQGRYLMLVEWPERGASALPAADLTVDLSHAENGRDLRAVGGTSRAAKWLESVATTP